MYFAVALCLRPEIEDKVEAGRLMAAGLVVIEYRYNNPGVSFFVMLADIPREPLVPVAGKPAPSFRVTESRDLPLEVIDLRKYRLRVAAEPRATPRPTRAIAARIEYDDDHRIFTGRIAVIRDGVGFYTGSVEGMR